MRNAGTERCGPTRRPLGFFLPLSNVRSPPDTEDECTPPAHLPHPNPVPSTFSIAARRQGKGCGGMLTPHRLIAASPRTLYCRKVVPALQGDKTVLLGVTGSCCTGWGTQELGCNASFFPSTPPCFNFPVHKGRDTLQKPVHGCFKLLLDELFGFRHNPYTTCLLLPELLLLQLQQHHPCCPAGAGKSQGARKWPFLFLAAWRRHKQSSHQLHSQTGSLFPC